MIKNITGQVTLAQLKDKLSTGPIFIGENHKLPFAREAVKDLIKDGNVQALFLELPDGSKQDEREAKYLALRTRDKDQTIEQPLIGGYNMWDRSTRNNPFLMGDLIKTALEKGGIAVYFHDVPVNGRGQSLIDGEYRSSSYSGSIEGMRARNNYSIEIIKKNSSGMGTIILAGQDHLDPKQIGEEYTLQYLLGYENDRVFDLSNLSKVVK